MSHIRIARWKRLLRSADAGDVAPRGKRAAPTGRRTGRPRKWESETERKRAYRERLAADLAEPQRLRRELGNERKRVASRDQKVAALKRELTRAEAQIDRHGEREAELELTIERLESSLADWRSRARALSDSLDKERSRAPSAIFETATGPRKPRPKPPPTLSRGKGGKRRRRR